MVNIKYHISIPVIISSLAISIYVVVQAMTWNYSNES